MSYGGFRRAKKNIGVGVGEGVTTEGEERVDLSEGREHGRLQLSKIANRDRAWQERSEFSCDGDSPKNLGEGVRCHEGVAVYWQILENKGRGWPGEIG